MTKRAALIVGLLILAAWSHGTPQSQVKNNALIGLMNDAGLPLTTGQ